MTREVAANSATSDTSTRLRWGRIIGGAFLLELVLVIVLVPPLQIFGPEKVVPVAYPAVLIIGFIVTWWVLRKVPQRPVLHGLLVGIIATAIYVGLCAINPDGIQSVIAMYGLFGFIAGNGLRIVGCIAAGYALKGRS